MHSRARQIAGGRRGVGHAPGSRREQRAPPPALPSLLDQAARLIALRLPEFAGVSPAALWDAAARSEVASGLLVVNPALVPPSSLAPMMRLGDKEGFVVVDMSDIDAFAPIEGVAVPDAPAYIVTDPDRGDTMANWSPDEALPAILGAGRSPLAAAEGIHWALQVPGIVERTRCYMTIGSRLRKPGGRLDARTPAVWISNGTGRDGVERRGAPKVGWCWAGNRHTWLGFASAETRLPLT